MEIDEVFVKDNPGLCRCCLSEGCYKDLASNYAWMGDTEIYADMLLECFDISISQQVEGPNGLTRLICEVCITRLRDACNFKKQVVESENKFIDMIGRGEFRQKVYETSITKQELTFETEETDGTEPEYLHGADYTEPDEDDEVLANLATTSRPQETPKRSRGRPKKTTGKTTPSKTKVKAEKKKVVKEEGKKARGSEVKEKTENAERLYRTRRNVIYILHYGNAMPFLWYSKGLKCFYCRKDLSSSELLKEHMIAKHSDVDIESFVLKKVVSKDVPIKVDVTNIGCRICGEQINSFEELIEHLVSKHDVEYDKNITSVLPFNLNSPNCLICGEVCDNTRSVILHVLRTHLEHPFICHFCGSSYTEDSKLKSHISHNHIGYKCKLCDKRFTAYTKMLRHRELFHGQKKFYECALCEHKFERPYNLNVHMGTEHNVAKYKLKCNMCEKYCTTKGALSLHVKLKHSETSYKCDLCEYKSGIKWLVTLHRRSHLKEKDYECTLCQKRFGRSSNLSAHMKVHGRGQGRVCRWCRQGFSDPSELQAHITSVHDFSKYC